MRVKLFTTGLKRCGGVRASQPEDVDATVQIVGLEIDGERFDSWPLESARIDLSGGATLVTLTFIAAAEIETVLGPPKDS